MLVNIFNKSDENKYVKFLFDKLKFNKMHVLFERLLTKFYG